MVEMGDSRSASRKAKLRDALIEKLMKKYYPGVPNSETERTINAEVDKLLTLPKVTESDLELLEKKIRRVSTNEVQTMLLSPFGRVVDKKTGLKDEWGTFNKVQLQIQEKQEREKFTKVAKERVKTKADLDEQMRLIEERKRTQSLEKVKDAEAVKKAVRKYQDDSESFKKTQLQKFAEQRKAREEEMALVAARKQREKDQLLEEDRQQLRNVQRAMQEEQRALAAKKAADSERLKKWKTEMERDLKIKEEKKLEKQAADRAYVKEYFEQMDRKEAERLKQVQELKERMKGKETIGMAVGKKMAEKAKEDEQRMQAVMKAAQAKAEAEYQAVQALKEKKKRDLRASLEQQIKAQEERKEIDKIENAKQAKVWKKSTHDAMNAEMEARQRKKEVELQHRLGLEDQIRHRAQTMGRADLCMSEQERQFNQGLLKKVQNI